MQWPSEKDDSQPSKYPYPYAIDNTWDWKTLDQIQDTMDDSENVKYNLQQEFNITMKKKEVEFDPNKLHLFRVSL